MLNQNEAVSSSFSIAYKSRTQIENNGPVMGEK